MYRFKITLLETSPPIWRLIETKNVSLEKLNELIQTAMGWTNSHLHQFEICGVQYTHPRFIRSDFDDFGAKDYSGIHVSMLVAKYGSRFRMKYVYDFGDEWEHDVVLEAVEPAVPRVQYPRCIDGQLACPPEDVGGVPGFNEFLATIADPSDPEHETMLEWSGPFDPAAFDAKMATRRMKKELPAW